MESAKALPPPTGLDVSADPQGLGVRPCAAWSVITARLPTQDSDHRYWWQTTGYTFAILLEEAGYSVEAQFSNLLFYYVYVVPELGPEPRSDRGLPNWMSSMTDNYIPVEFSWSWGSGDEPVVVRFSIEPIGTFAGTQADPLNEHAVDRVVHHVQSLLPGTDLGWYHHFSHELLLDSQSFNDTPGLQEVTERSQRFIAFDLDRSGLALKAYFMPALKAAKTGKTRLEILSHAIESLEESHFATIQESYSILFAFLRMNEHALRLEVEILAIDCLAATASRLKIYLQSRSTSFDSVRRVMTMDGRICKPNLMKGLQDLKELWKLLVWNGQHFESCDDLPFKDHRTAGILYYFEIRPGQAHPTPKIYIPVRHYSCSDYNVADQLVDFLSSRHSAFEVKNYMQALEHAFPARLLKEECGAQTYIGCIIKDGSLNIISYINPGAHGHASAYSG